MGYSIGVKPNDNFDKFRVKVEPYDITKYLVKYLVYKVMSFDKTDLSVTDVMNIVFDLDVQLDKLITYYKEKERHNLTQMFDNENPEYREKGELVFHGWEFCESKRNRVDLDDTKQYVLDTLFTLMTLTKHYDYYDDGERFCEKRQSVEEVLDYLADECMKSVDIEVINSYPNDDGYDELKKENEAE